MSIYLGSTTISNAYLGTSAVSAIYLGSNQVWTSGPPLTPTSIIIGGLGGLTPAYTQANLEAALTNETITSFTSQSGNIYADSSTPYSMSIVAFLNNTNITSYRDGGGCVKVGASSGPGAFNGANKLTLVSLPSASYVGINSFSNCVLLVSASLPKATELAPNAFYNCTSLSYINFPSASVIGGSAFRDTFSLRNINLPAATTVGSTAFQDSYFISASLPSLTTLALNTFYNTFSASYLDLSGLTNPTAFDNEVFIGMGYALQSNLQYGYPNTTGTVIVPSYYLTSNAGSPSVNLSYLRVYPRNYKIDYVKSNYVFIGGCAADTSQGELSNYCWQGSTITSYATSGPNIYVSSSTDYNTTTSAFEQFTTMTSYIDGGRCINIGNRSFWNCLALVTASFAKATTVGEYAFSGSALRKINIPAVTSIGNYAFAGCSVLTTPDLAAINTIGNYTFMSCSGFTGDASQIVRLPTLTTIGTGAYASSSIPGIQANKVTSVGAKAFENCYNLTYIQLTGLVGNNALGGSPTNNGVFTDVPNNGNITVPSYLEQSNNGGLDGDIDYLQNTKNWNVIYV